MKFNVPSKVLYSAVSSVSKIINPKNALNILDNFLVELKDDVLTITGSDTENTLSARVNVTEVEGSGRLCIHARRLVEMVKEIPDQGITFHINDTTFEIDITYSSGKYNLVGISGDEYPEYKLKADESEPFTFTTKGENIIKALEYTMFAVGNDDYRPMMQGILFDIVPEQITFVATDTRKLVRYIDKRIQANATARCILPMKPATVLRNVFPKDATLSITISAKNAIFETDTMKLQCSFINGNYPDYNRVIPQKHPYLLTADRATLLTAVRRVGVFVDPSFGLEKFRITPERLMIKTDDNNMCTSARDSVACSFTGTELTIGFSAHHLSDILGTMNTEEVLIDLADPGRPGVFRPSENEEGTDLLMLLMPMTVGEF
jgi:DNA polymerase-3 subunit beta